MKKRVIALLLAMVTILSLAWLPEPAEAVATTPSEIEQQIRTIYRRALAASGKSSFHGYCGAMVSWQLYCMGIDKQVYACNGNDQFDLYNSMSKTTGGYSIKTYPASQYTLLTALNAITHNGTQDAYNMVVGFQKTNTQAGQRYGHALLIHAVIDGIVYFVEGYDTYVAGTYFNEGEPIKCTIEEFAVYYDRWTVFDGIAYFGLRTYADVCTYYPCAMKAMAVSDGYIYEEPGDAGILEPESVSKLYSGQWLTVDALLETPNGEYWYQIKQDGYSRYVRAEKLVMGSVDKADITVSNLKMPNYIHNGYGFTLGGTVSTKSSTIRDVYFSVYSTESYKLPIFSGAMDVGSKSVSLSKAQLNNALAFRQLPAGSYELRLMVDLLIYVSDGRNLETRNIPVELWKGRFLVVNDWLTYPSVKFNGNGGSPKLDQVVLAKNKTVGDLPTAERSGYTFLGWSLDKAGTQMATADMVIKSNTTLYAQWTPGHSGTGGWQETEEGWHYCAGDSPVAGWFQFGDLQFYQYSDGTLANGWVFLEGKLRYFNEAGALVTHLNGHSGIVFEAKTEGDSTLGWVTGGKNSTGPVEMTAEQLQQRQEMVEKMPAAGKAMQKLSASLYWLAVKISSGTLPEQIKNLAEQNERVSP